MSYLIRCIPPLIGQAASTDSHWKPEDGTLYDLPLKDPKGNDFDTETLKNKVVLIVNTASKCGYTKGGYTAMSSIHDKYKDQGFTVLAFPCNQFGAQEPGTPEEIKEFVCERFKGNFPIMQKADVNGDEEQPVYKWLKKSFPGDITWNFAAKFLISREGVPIARFEKESWETIDERIGEVIAAKPAAVHAAAAGEAAPKAESPKAADSKAE